LTEKYPKIHAVATIADLSRNSKCGIIPDDEMNIPLSFEKSGANRAISRKGTKSRAEINEPTNNTGKTAL
jgi:hypothetical protein